MSYPVLLVQPCWLELGSHSGTSFFYGRPQIGANRRLLGERMSPSSEERNLWYMGNLNESEGYFRGAELRCASSRKGEHRQTIAQVLTLQERHQRFPTRAKPIYLRVALRSSKFQSVLRRFPRWVSIIPQLGGYLLPWRARREWRRSREDRSTAWKPPAQPVRNQSPRAGEANLCRANHQRMWNIDVAPYTHQSSDIARAGRNPQKGWNCHSLGSHGLGVK